jgi:CDP-diglyceride synthetase
MRLLHLGLLISDLLGRIRPLSIAPALLGISAIGAWPWGQPALQAVIGVALALFILGDGVSLALLPRRGRSYGPVTPPLLALALMRMTVAFAMGRLWPTPPAAVAAVALQTLITAVQVYATWVEPFRLTVTSLEVASPQLQRGNPCGCSI